MDTQVTTHLQPPFFVIYFNPFLGNGIQCMDANGTWAVSGDAFVELEMTLTSEVRIIMMRMMDKEIDLFPGGDLPL